MSFFFDQSNVVEEVTACSAVVAEYYTGQLAYPASVADVEATIAAFREKLTANGIDKIIDEFNASIAEGIPQKIEHNDLRWITVEEIDQYEFCPADEEILRRLKEL